MASAVILEEEEKDEVTWAVAKEVNGIFGRASGARGPSKSSISRIKTDNMELKVNQSNGHEEEKDVSEQRKEYDTADVGGATLATVGSTVLIGATEVIAAEVAASAGAAVATGAAALAAAPAVLVGGSVILAGGLIYNGVQWVRQKNEDSKLGKKQSYNNLTKEYNEKRQEYLEIGATLTQNKKELHDQLEKIEKEMKHCQEDLLKQRYDLNGKIIMLVGPSGFGKSMAARRLIGNSLDCDENQDDSLTNEVFAVAQEGKLKSQTKTLQCERKGIKINGTFIYNLSVIDTPGAFDTDGQTDEFYNNMSEYMIQIGGVNMFAVFFRYGHGAKFDSNYQNLLKMYQEFWGNSFWNNCAIFITNCDRDTDKNKRKLGKGLPTTKQEIKEFLVLKMGLDARSVEKIPMFEFGESNFEQSVLKIMITLADEKGAFFQKYECKSIKSPVKKTWDQIRETYHKYQTIGSQLYAIKARMNSLKNQFE